MGFNIDRPPMRNGQISYPLAAVLLLFRRERLHSARCWLNDGHLLALFKQHGYQRHTGRWELGKLTLFTSDLTGWSLARPYPPDPADMDPLFDILQAEIAARALGA